MQEVKAIIKQKAELFFDWSDNSVFARPMTPFHWSSVKVRNVIPAIDFI